MSNEHVLATMGGAAGPLANLDALDSKTLRELCRGMAKDLSFLASMVPGNVGTLVSTALTGAAAVAAGAIDAYLGDKASLGPVALSAAIAAGMAVVATLAKDPDTREGAAAVARGFGAPILHACARKRVAAWKDTVTSGRPGESGLQAVSTWIRRKLASWKLGATKSNGADTQASENGTSQ